MYKPRRPAQLKPEQIDLIQGEQDTAHNSELAHTTAQAVVPINNAHTEDDPEVTQRILALIEEEGIDVLAESWVASPDDSLPGILWRGFLLREWIRRFPDEARARYAAAKQAGDEGEPSVGPLEVRGLWDDVFAGNYRGDFTAVLRMSAELTNFLAQVEPTWISQDEHPLATEVTRRNLAMQQTAAEFDVAARLSERSSLQ